MTSNMKDLATWTPFLKSISEQNAGRRTRLGVFELKGDVVNDYWLEDGLPLVAVESDLKNGRRDVRIVVGEMEHDVRDVIKITYSLTSNSTEDGLDILDRSNRTTILRFER